MSWFNNDIEQARLKALHLEILNLRGLQGSLVTWLGAERRKNTEDLRKERAKSKPSEKKVYSLLEVGHVLSEAQNRVLDNNWGE